MSTEHPGHLLSMTVDPAALSANSETEALSERVQSGYLQDAYYEWLDPVLQDNPQATAIMTLIGVCLIAWQVFLLIHTFSKKGARATLVAPPLVGGILMSAMLLMPTVMMPFILGIIDWIIGFVVSIFSQAGS